MVVELIRALPNEQALLELIHKFENLLKKYAYMLQVDDAYEDLRLFFIELLYCMSKKEDVLENDARAVSYIKTSVEHRFYHMLKLNKKNKLNEINFSDFSDEQLFLIEQENSCSIQDSISDYFPLKVELTQLERKIITEIYTYNRPVSEIAGLMNISRQAVNQTKIRALKKIRKYYKCN